MQDGETEGKYSTAKKEEVQQKRWEGQRKRTRNGKGEGRREGHKEAKEEEEKKEETSQIQ